MTRTTIACGAALLLLTGCGTAADDDAPWTIDRVIAEARAAGQDRVVELLEDGEITLEQLQRFEDEGDDCLRALGVTIGERMINPVDGWFTVRELRYDGLDIEHDQDLRDAVEACNAEWDVGWLQVAYDITHDDVMDEPLMHAVRACLGAAGHETTGRERNAGDLLAGEEQGPRLEALRTCIADEAFRLYPDLPGLPIAYGS